MVNTAFPKQIAELGELVREVVLDVEALSQPVSPCKLSSCGGTCCHDGVYLSSEEANTIRDLADSKKSELAKLGAQLPEQVVVYGRYRDIASGPKTATNPNPEIRSKVADYPKHFPETKCVFLLPDARCSLQALAMSEKLPPWFYKPLTCWIHPLAFTQKNNHSVLTLYSEKNDPHTFDDYPGFGSKTHCGRTCTQPEAAPAYKVLSEELKYLGEISGRNLIAEISEQLES